MTNSDKSLLKRMILDGKSDVEISKNISCAKQTIRKYRRALKTINTEGR